MAIVPKPVRERISFYQAKLPNLEAHAVAVGTTPEAVEDLAAKVEAARLAFAEQSRAMQTAQVATQRLQLTLKEMSVAGAAIIMQVRSKARLTGDDSIFPLATLPAPAAKRPMGAPGTPSKLLTDLHGDGSLGLRWECKNPRGSCGTIYHLYRRVGRNGRFEYLGLSGEKQYTDKTIPNGATWIEYEIQAVRSTAKGERANFPVAFGTNGAPPLPEFIPAGKRAA